MAAATSPTSTVGLTRGESPDAGVGHHDRQGGGHSSHDSWWLPCRGLAETAGNGRFYCFASG
jgi:hypothetical protein